MKFGVRTIAVGAFEVNCYLVEVDEVSYVVDPGADAQIILQEIKSLGLAVKNILLTHAHIDHVSAVKEVAEVLRVPVYLHEKDISLYKSPMNKLEPFYPPLKSFVVPVSTLDDNNIEIIHTPGHTQGGVCFYFKGGNTLFSGDTIFCESVGRTDLSGGSHSQLIQSIRTKILTLPDGTKIYPGHGESTTVLHEKQFNPFFMSGV